MTDGRSRLFAYGVLVAMPLFFSSNLIIGRAAIGHVEPFTLAFLRWSLAFLILLPFAWRGLVAERRLIAENWETLATLAILGMWICGALVYEALRYTTASNGTLIYTSSPVLIVLLEWLFRGRRIAWREALGILFALAGVVVIVVQGSFERLTALRFNGGDLIFAAAAVAWAVYSVMLKKDAFKRLPTAVLFAAIAGGGALVLMPFALYEIFEKGRFPTGGAEWASIFGVALVASVLAFSSFQYGVKVLGPSVTGVFMYLLPPYGVMMAVLFLGEKLEFFHLKGFVLVFVGIVLATAPVALVREKLARRKAAAAG